MNRYAIEYTDTFSGEANYSWVKRASVTMPELTHYGYTGSTDGTYARASKAYRRVLLRKAKATVGLSGVRGRVTEYGEGLEFRPYKSCTVLFVTYTEE